MNHIVAGQLNMAFSLMLPLMAYLVVVWRDGKLRSSVFIGLLGIAMAVQFYLFLETFADMTVVWIIALAVGYGLGGRAGRPVVARLSWRVGLAYLLAIALTAPYLKYALAHVPAGFARSPAISELDLASLVVPWGGQTFGLSWLAHDAAQFSSPARDGYVGIPILLVALLLAAFTWSRKIVRFLTVMLVLLIVLAFGPDVDVEGRQVFRVPWAHLWFLPIARSAFPARFMVFAFLALAVMLAIWLAGPAKSVLRLRLRWPLALLAIAAMAANIPPLSLQPVIALPAFVATAQYRHYLAPGDTIVVVSTNQGNTGLLWQAQTNFYFRLAGGFINAAVNQRTDLPVPVADLGREQLTPAVIQQFRTFVRQGRISAILVVDGANPRWYYVFHRLRIRPLTVGGALLYPTRGIGGPARRLR
jgi:hypothetical protein